MVQKHRGARSSAGERLLHTQDVAGSIPAVPTVPDPIAAMLTDDAWRMAVETRFWPKVMKPLDWSGCWEWQGTRSGRGYGRFKLKSYVSTSPHRLSYALFTGRSPGGLFVCHHCDNPPCCNPAHLFLGTVQDNSDDMVRKGRAAKRDQSGERNGAAKLAASDVEAIRAKILSGLTNVAIAAQYGVTHQIISKIRRGRAWGGEPMQAPYRSLKRASYR
jgi:hypothetical protein